MLNEEGVPFARRESRRREEDGEERAHAPDVRLEAVEARRVVPPQAVEPRVAERVGEALGAAREGLVARARSGRHVGGRERGLGEGLARAELPVGLRAREGGGEFVCVSEGRRRGSREEERDVEEMREARDAPSSARA